MSDGISDSRAIGRLAAAVDEIAGALDDDLGDCLCTD
jgi:hypothetical protein